MGGTEQMKVKELIEQLQKQDQNKQIKIFDDISVDAYPVEGVESYFDDVVVITWN